MSKANILQLCIVVHSAGVGRTGTYIALDIMLQQLPKANTINVYECVRNMRAKRLFMVQTLVSQDCVYTPCGT